jgi:predicted RNA-binding Zn-ribbon protein involved in translation (DUF1610 family)
MNVEAIEHEDGSLQVLLDAKPLTCPVCGNQRYHERGFVLNTRGSEFLGVAWVDDKASNFICTRCGYMFCSSSRKRGESRLGDPPDLPLVDRLFGRERP